MPSSSSTFRLSLEVMHSQRDRSGGLEVEHFVAGGAACFLELGDHGFADASGPFAGDGENRGAGAGDADAERAGVIRGGDDFVASGNHLGTGGLVKSIVHRVFEDRVGVLARSLEER